MPMSLPHYYTRLFPASSGQQPQLCGRGFAVPFCSAPQRAAQLFLEQHREALTLLGVEDSSVLFCCTGLLPYKGLSEGTSRIMENSLQ